jgi:hypothetical protein
MQLSPSALLAAVCYVTRELRVLLIVITETNQRNETSCEGYVATSVNTNKSACRQLSNIQQILSGLQLI